MKKSIMLILCLIGMASAILFIVTSCDKETEYIIETSWLWDNVNAVAPELARELPKNCTSLPFSDEYKKLFETHFVEIWTSPENIELYKRLKIPPMLFMGTYTVTITCPTCNETAVWADGACVENYETDVTSWPSECGGDSGNWTWNGETCGGHLEGYTVTFNDCMGNQ